MAPRSAETSARREASEAKVGPDRIRDSQRSFLANALGHRRHRIDTLRRLVFIGMMQDARLTLDEVYRILHAAMMAERKSIASQRLAALDEQLAQLQHARGLLAGALWCR